MNRIFLDANILFSAAWRPDSGLSRLWKLADTALVTSHYAAEEARRNLDNADQRSRLLQLMVVVQRVPDCLAGKLPGHVNLPDKDRPILLAAINAQASHLLTGDRQHFGNLYGKSIGGIFVVPPADYPELG
jgi:predicted nucleic acid-binding protein